MNKAFFIVHCKCLYGQDCIRFDEKEKNYFSFKALVVAKKKTQDFLPSFQT